MIGLIEAIQEKIELNEFWVPMDSSLTDDNNWNNPDIRPNKSDGGFDGWFRRLSTWGEIRFTFFNKEGKKEELSQSEFIRKILVNNIQELYSGFRIELRHIYEVDFIRTLQDTEGHSYEEVFKVYVKLKPELKKGLSLWTKFFN